MMNALKTKLISRKNLRLSQSEFTSFSYETVFNPHREETPKAAREIENELREKERKWQLLMKTESQNAHERGYEQGLEEGQKQALQEIHSRLAPVKKMLQDVDEQLDAFFANLKPLMNTVVFELAEKVVQIPISQNEELTEYVSQQISGFLQEIKAESEVKIRVSDADYEPIAQELLKSEKYNNIKISTDNRMNTGEYEIETDYEAIINSFPMLIKQFRNSLELTEA